MSNANLVLDTHVWLWLVDGRRRLGDDTHNLVAEAAGDGRLLLPAIVPWEVALLTSMGRLQMTSPPREWIEAALRMPGLQLHPLTPDIAVDACYLPSDFHGDPADRLIVATARATDSTLVTRDTDILAYGESGHLKVLAA